MFSEDVWGFPFSCPFFTLRNTVFLLSSRIVTSDNLDSGQESSVILYRLLRFVLVHYLLCLERRGIKERVWILYKNPIPLFTRILI